jgi:MtN3 and saliva related transmembrane protein
MIHDWIGYFAAACTTGSYIPQAIKAYRTRKTKDLSWAMFGLNTLGVAIWLVYGWLTQDVPLIAANIVTLGLGLFILGIKYFDGD